MRRAVSAAAVWGVLLVGCSGSDESESGAPPPPISFVTFNAALGVGFSENPAERLTVIQRDLPSLGADVICLQEVWQPADIDTLVAGLAGDYPHAHYSVSEIADAVAGGCTQEEADLLGNCLADNCGALPEAEVAACAIENCADDFTTVSPECQACVAANQSADPTSIAEICGPDGANTPQYAEQNGLLLLSRQPLENAGFLALDSSLGDRGILFARIGSETVPSAALFCTHLAATQPEIPYTGPHDDWTGERRAQLARMLEYVEEQTTSEDARVLLGDMNCGPPTSEALAADAESFALFTNAGYEAPYLTDPGTCTWCAENPMTGDPTDIESNAVIDHVLIARVPTDLPRSAARVFDDLVDLEVGGEVTRSYRSDHFGALVALGEPAEEP